MSGNIEAMQTKIDRRKIGLGEVQANLTIAQDWTKAQAHKLQRDENYIVEMSREKVFRPCLVQQIIGLFGFDPLGP